MTHHVNHVGDAELRARVRRLSRRVMAILDHDRIWSGPMGEIATLAAVVRDVESMLRSGEDDDQVVIQHVLETVCSGRVMSALRPRMLPIAMTNSDRD